MTKSESLVVSAILAVACPLLVGVACWWTAALLFFAGVAHLSERGIATAAFAGLAIGLGADLLWLKRWAARFYTVDLRLMGVIYLGSAAIALAFCMGLPAGNLVLGTLAGVYVGRRGFHAGASHEARERLARRAAAFTAFVTGAGALGIGLLVLHEGSAVRILAAWLPLEPATIAGPTGGMIVFALVLVLIIFQLWCTRTAARLAFGWGSNPGG